MASTIHVRLPLPVDAPGGPCLDAGASSALVERALEVFADVEQACTRFVATSPLSNANAAPQRWHRGPAILLNALAAAYGAYRLTDHRFDPRVLDAMVALGYTNVVQFKEGEQVALPASLSLPAPASGEWHPKVLPRLGRFHLAGDRVDLGGIGKGLAVRWASDRLQRHCKDFLIEAGGDCYCSGHSADRTDWRVAVEDPFGRDDPVAVLQVSDRAVATSSVRLRHWRVGATEVHHLIDPRTYRPGGDGLMAVTVVASDPALAEVWSKVLFLEGATGIENAAEHRGIAALWVDDDGGLGSSSFVRDALMWVRR